MPRCRILEQLVSPLAFVIPKIRCWGLEYHNRNPRLPALGLSGSIVDCAVDVARTGQLRRSTLAGIGCRGYFVEDRITKEVVLDKHAVAMSCAALYQFSDCKDSG